MPNWARGVGLLICLTCLPDHASAQDSGSWGVMVVPGSIRLIEDQANWRPSGIGRTEFAHELIRYLYSQPLGRVREIQQVAAAFQVLKEFGARVTALNLPQPLVLGATDRERQKRWQDLFDLLGYSVDFPKGSPPRTKAHTDPDAKARQAVFEDVGIATDDVVASLTSGKAVTLTVPSFELPLPLDRETWTRYIVNASIAPGDLFPSIVGNREFALIYDGLVGLDAQTLAFFRHEQPLFQAALDHPTLLAEFSRSLRVRGGRVLTPGGDAADAAWRDLVGESPTTPDRFLKRLIEGDGARLAWFYDAVMHMGPRQQRYVLGLWLAPAQQRIAARRALDQFESFTGAPDFLRTPFTRREFDPVAALSELDLAADGTPTSLTSPAFVDRALDTLDFSDPGRAAPVATGTDALLTAATFLDIVFSGPRANARPRAEAIAYGQSLARHAPSISPANLTVAMRAYLRFPALLKALDRIPVTRPAVLSAAIARAEVLRHALAPEAWMSLAQYQSVLAVLEAGVVSGGIAPKVAEDLIEEASGIETDDHGSYEGKMGEWLAHQFVDRLRKEVDVDPADPSLEAVLRSALAGKGIGRPLPELEWAGFKYVADLPAVEARRIETVRVKMGSPRFDLVASLARLPGRLTSATSLDQVQAVAGEFDHDGPSLVRYLPQTRLLEPDATSISVLDSVTKELRAAKNPKDSHVKRATDELRWLTDRVVAYGMMSWVYAAHLDDATTPLLLAGDVSVRHDFGLFEEPTAFESAATSNASTVPKGSGIRRPHAALEQLPWSEPIAVLSEDIPRACPGAVSWGSCVNADQRREGVDREGVPWHVEGSLFSFDVLLDVSIPSNTKSVDQLNAHPLLEFLWQGLSESVPLQAVDDPLDPATLTNVSTAIRRGRQAASEHRDRLEVLPEWRYAALPWAATHEPEALTRLVSESDLFDFGAASGPAVDALGGGMNVTSGCLCLKMLSPRTRDLMAYYPGGEYVGVVLSDLRLRIAELLEEAKLPADLEPVLVKMAMRAVMTRVGLGDDGEWLSVTAAMSAVSRKDLDGFLAQMTQSGALRLSGHP
jgi:hypothetical protein